MNNNNIINKNKSKNSYSNADITYREIIIKIKSKNFSTCKNLNIIKSKKFATIVALNIKNTRNIEDLQGAMNIEDLQGAMNREDLQGAMNIKDTVIPGIRIPSLYSLNKELSNTNILEKSVNIYKIIINLLETLQDINSKGYINDTDLYNYDLIKEIIPYIIKDSKKPLGDKFVNIGKNKMDLGNAMELYKFAYNLLNLNLYLVSEYILKDLEIFFKDKYEEEEEDIDILYDYKNITKILLQNLDPCIRELFTKRGMSIIQNIYTGFDTEYQNIDSKTNKLLSVQMAITNKTLLKLPIQKDFDFERYNISTNSFYKRENKVVKGWIIDETVVKDIINKSGKYLRDLKLANYDNVFKKLVEGLKSNNISFIEHRNDIYFIFDKNLSVIKEWYKITNEAYLRDLVGISYGISKEGLDRELSEIYDLLKDIYEGELDLDLSENNNLEKFNDVEKFNDIERIYVESNEEFVEKIEKLEKLENKKYRRSYNQSISHERISVTKKINNYFIGHLTTADLSMLKDIEDVIDDFDILNKSFVSLRKPLLIAGVNVIIRDTMLLAPGGRKSLDAIGKMYNNLEKIEIPDDYKSNMSKLLVDNPNLFKKYAMQDAVITLIHGCFMDTFFNKIGGIGVPLTLSTLSGNYIKEFWKKNKYEGYQVSQEYLLTQVSKTNTPKGLSVVKDIGLMNNYYIASYRGGRNETFMFGKDKSNCIWYDYDLVSAYTTVMSGLGTPNYNKARSLSIEEFNKMKWKDIIYSYTVLNVEFKFPENVKYPTIPCNIDENTTVYPKEGKSIITSLEYIVSKNLGCEFKIKDIKHIPFQKDKPFFDCIKELQGIRGKYKKGTINNLLYKEIGNSLYGLTVRGISDRKKYDIKSNSMKRMEGNELSNPLIASWITSFTRSVIGELLNGVKDLQGRIISVTTDGFLTDIENFEEKFLKIKGRKNCILKEYRTLRLKLSGNNNNNALELKNSGSGIITWCTRGQISEDAGLMAMTGYQRGNNKISEVYSKVSEVLLTKVKTFNFLTSRLRSAKDIYLKGGHVTMIYSDQVYRIMFDNKRVILDKDLNENVTLFDSEPLKNVEEGKMLRFISKLPKTISYSKMSGSGGINRYKSNEELMIRNFIKALLRGELNLNSDSFKNYHEIVKFIKDYKSDITISENYIAQLKRRGNFVKVPRFVGCEKFVDHIRKRFKDFDDTGLFFK